MGILGLHHTTAVVPDLAQAVEFYTRVLGFAVVQEVSIADPQAHARDTYPHPGL